MTIDEKAIKLFNKIDTVQEYYRCTNCGHDTKQHVNGRIRYMQLSETDRHFIKEHYKNG